MFDEGYFAGMALGPPQVSIDGLNELAVVLKLHESDSGRTISSFDKEGERTCGEKANIARRFVRIRRAPSCVTRGNSRSV
jgi:hypothetical protein